MNIKAPLFLTLLSVISAGCGAAPKAAAPDRLLASEVPTKITKSNTGDFFVDAKTDLSWSTRVSVGLDYLEAPSYCVSLGAGWRLPTLGELTTMTEGTGEKKRLRKAFRTGLSVDALLFSRCCAGNQYRYQGAAPVCTAGSCAPRPDRIMLCAL